jgi:PAS domain-containing protein
VVQRPLAGSAATLQAMEAIALLAESKIRAAMAEGKFDWLPGRGRPLPDDGLARVPPELRMGFKLLRNAGCLPPELEARKEAARLGALIATTADAAERRRLSRLRAEAELRYRLLIEGRTR